MGVSEGRAVRSAESALSGASKRLRREDLTQSNNPTSLLSAVRRLPTFLGREQGVEVPYTRWIATSAVFPAPHSRVLSGEAIRAEGERILADVESAHDLPPLHANAVINAEWGGSIIETRDRLALAVYAAVGLRHVPVKITAPPTSLHRRQPDDSVPSTPARVGEPAHLLGADRQRPGPEGPGARPYSFRGTSGRGHKRAVARSRLPAGLPAGRRTDPRRRASPVHAQSQRGVPLPLAYG